ncbi:MAG: hypothetical protein QXI39_06450 [Candidatus Bathyarchaeia archaeon]
MMNMRKLILLGILLIVTGVAFSFFGETVKEWYIGEGTDLTNSKTWTIRGQSIGFATPWTYDLGTIPEGTYIYAAYNVTTVETRTGVARPGLTRHILIDVDTGDILQRFDMGAYTVLPKPLLIMPRKAHVIYKIESVLPTMAAGTILDPTPVEFDACVQAYKLITVYPYRIIGLPLLLLGVGLIIYSKRRKD